MTLPFISSGEGLEVQKGLGSWGLQGFKNEFLDPCPHEPVSPLCQILVSTLVH